MTKQRDNIGGGLPRRYDVDPAELFFDLVVVLAVARLSHHLLEHVTWRGAAETAVLVVPVCAAWYYTSWQVTLLRIERSQALALLLGVMLVGLFMNASIEGAFDGSGWDFVLPFLLIQLGGVTWTVAHAPSALWKNHYQRTLIWLVGTAPLWALGAAADAEHRLLWWAVAGTIDLAGTWFAHPLPSKRLESADTGFEESPHMVERYRLFLIVALGETILTTGTALASTDWSPLTLITAAAAFSTTVALWFLLFRGVAQTVADHIEQGTTDPLRATRLAGNVLTLIVAGLIALAVGNELAIAHPDDDTSPSLSLLVFGGLSTVLLAQGWLLWAVPHARNARRITGVAVLGVLGVVTALAAPPAFVSQLVTAAVVTTLAYANSTPGSPLRRPGKGTQANSGEARPDRASRPKLD